MIKDGFGQGYLFDNHWSATVMDGEEDLLPPPLPPHNGGSLFWSPLIHSPRPSSRSRLTLKEKYQIELKLLAHPKQRPARLKNHTSVPTIRCCKVNSSLFLALSLSLTLSGRVVMWIIHASGATACFIMLKCPWHYWWSHRRPRAASYANAFGRRKEKSLQHLKGSGGQEQITY